MFVSIKEISPVKIKRRKLFLKLFSIKKPKSLSLEQSVSILYSVPARRLIWYRHFEYQIFLKEEKVDNTQIGNILNRCLKYTVANIALYNIIVKKGFIMSNKGKVLIYIY